MIPIIGISIMASKRIYTSSVDTGIVNITQRIKPLTFSKIGLVLDEK